MTPRRFPLTVLSLVALFWSGAALSCDKAIDESMASTNASMPQTTAQTKAQQPAKQVASTKSMVPVSSVADLRPVAPRPASENAPSN
jgi:hypothetical protein